MTDQTNDFITTRQLAQLYRLSEATLRNWRVAGKGPVHVKFGGCVRYRLSDVTAYAALHTQVSTSRAS